MGVSHLPPLTPRVLALGESSSAARGVAGAWRGESHGRTFWVPGGVFLHPAGWRALAQVGSLRAQAHHVAKESLDFEPAFWGTGPGGEGCPPHMLPLTRKGSGDSGEPRQAPSQPFTLAPRLTPVKEHDG